MFFQMALTNLRCEHTFATCTKKPVEPRFIDFDDLEYPDTFRICSICVRVDVKFPVNRSDDNLPFILMDKTGAKIEVIVSGKDLMNRFNLTLHMGRNYIIHGVTVRPNFEELECRYIQRTYECSFSARTFVESLSLQFPTYPKHLMSFQEIQRCPKQTFVVGIVVHYDRHELIGRYPGAELYREVTFIDIWGKLMVVGVCSGKLIQNSYRCQQSKATNLLSLPLCFVRIANTKNWKLQITPPLHSTWIILQHTHLMVNCSDL
ncbi:hypothetical protein ZWY2020_037747 [Hordeum vulgare]|nr:hypothetical protein ZWY2020_037747 [Hordeum vulgare]